MAPGIVVPGRGFLLNNELTDFTTVYDPADPNRIEPSKRPRSSMSPTIVLKDGKPLLAVGSPGGSTIITTVLGILVNRLDLGMTLEQAIAAPRAAPSNRTPVSAEQGYLDLYGAALTALGHSFAPVGAPGTSAAEIGAATAIEFLSKRAGHGGRRAHPARRRRSDGGQPEIGVRSPLLWRGERYHPDRALDRRSTPSRSSSGCSVRRTSGPPTRAGRRCCRSTATGWPRRRSA